MPDMVYLNFDIEIEKANGEYRAHVLSSPAGEARAAVGPIEAEQPGASPEMQGGALFDAVFRDEVLSGLRRSLDVAERTEKGLRIRLRLADVPELADLPWELLYDRQRARFFALSRETPLVRYLDLPEPADSIRPEIRLRVLAVIASPSDYPALDVEREWANLKEALSELESRGTVTVDRLDPATIEGLQRQLLRHEYHILHFLGHGEFDEATDDSVLLLSGADNRGEAVSGETFSALVRDQRSLRLALLNACRGAVSSEQDPYSGVAQRLVRGGVPAVIAMRKAISDSAAIALARSFYTALADGAAVDEALAEARKALYTGGHAEEWGTAVLYMRAADGHLWRPDPAARRKRLTWVLAAAGAVLAVALIGLLIWSQLGAVRMDPVATMNIAVTDAADVTTSDGAVRTVDGELIRTWMVAALNRENQALEAGERVNVWHDGLPRTQKRNRLPVLMKINAEEREVEAAALAKAINADVVISGRIDEEGGRRQLVQEFFIFSRLAPEASESIGRYAFGEPIPLSPDLSEDALNRESVAAQVTARTALLYRIVLALREDVLGKHQAALDLLLDIESDLGLRDLPESQLVAKSGMVSGLDTLYAFLGREALFLGRNEEAEAAARKALAINERDVRASIILGGALMGQAEALDPLEALSPGGLFDGAETAYRTALENAPLSSTTHGVAQLALAHVQVSRGATLYRVGESEATDAEADILFDEAVRDLSPLLDSLSQSKQYRMIAQCRSYMGAARLYQGNLALQMQDPERAADLFEEAREHFAACVAQGDLLPEDGTLRDKIIGEGCTPGQQQASQALVQIGGG